MCVSTCGSAGADWPRKRGRVLAWAGTQTHTEARSEDTAIMTILTVNLDCTLTARQVLF